MNFPAFFLAYTEYRLRDRKSTRLNSSHTVIYTLSLHDALPISVANQQTGVTVTITTTSAGTYELPSVLPGLYRVSVERSEEHTSELQSHSDLHSFPTRRSSDLGG